jgi:PAS domain S-box-containing protein
MVNVRRLVAAPIFADEDQTRVAQILNFCLLVVFVGAGLFAIATPVLMPERLSRLPISLGAVLLSLVMLGLLRAGYIRATALIFTSILWLLFSYAALTSGGIQQPGFSLQFLVIVIATLTLGGRTALGFALLSGLFGVGMYLAQEAGTLPAPLVSFPPTSSIITQLVAMGAIALLMYRADQSINDALMRSRQSERALAERNRQLESEIAERKRVEAALLETQNRLTDAQTIANIGSWESDLITGAEIWSEETTRHLGFEMGSVTPSFDLFLQQVHPDDRPLVDWSVHQPFQSGGVYSTQYRIVLPDGSLRYIASRAVVKVDTDGIPARLVGMTQDITIQKQAEIALQDREEQLRLATDAARIGIWDWNVTTNAVKWSDHTYRIFDLSPEAFTETTLDFNSRVYPEDLPIARNILERADADGRIDIGDFRVVRSDGNLRWVYEQAKVYYDKSGKPVRVIGTIQDVTERKQAEQELREQTEILQAIFDNVPLMIAVFDHKGNFKLVNRAWEQIIGWTLEELHNDPHILKILYPDGDKYRQATEFITEAASKWGDFVTTVRDGRQLDIAWANIRLSNDVLIGIGQDITERKQAEKQHLELAVERERVGLLKEFIGNMSHDLKTPLTVLNTSLYLLERLNDPLNQQARIANMKQQVLLLQNLIEDILTMSRLDHTPDFALEAVNLNDLLYDVEHKLHPAAEHKRLVLTMEFDSHQPSVLANESELYRVMVNLVENAIKYTPDSGTVTIRTLQNGSQAVVEVADTGIGIGADELPHIFDRFFRADEARSVDTPGTGLGLAIVKRIVDMHNGLLNVDSTPGKGSVFRVSLPLAQ